MSEIEISIIVPCFNEAEGIAIFWQQLTATMANVTESWETIFINDGSSDKTLDVLTSLTTTSGAIRIIDFSRNFGKEAAITAGLDNAHGAAVVIIDADLQHPPELIPQMVQLWRAGTEVVLCRRQSRHVDSAIRAGLSNLFYKLASKLFEVEMPRNVGDFRLMDRVVVDALGRLRENQRFMKGLFAWIGFRTVIIDFEVANRAHGTSSFNLWRLLNFAVDGITSFTTVPLRIWFYIGIGMSFLAVAYGVGIVFSAFLFGNSVPGYPSIVALVAFIGGIQLIGIGVLGEYVGRTYKEVKFRPIYVVRKITENRPDRK
jgi:glycosyltransferase involved in cell wall biosynthesis